MEICSAAAAPASLILKSLLSELGVICHVREPKVGFNFRPEAEGGSESWFTRRLRIAVSRL